LYANEEDVVSSLGRNTRTERDESYLVNAEDGGGSIGSELEGRGLAGQKIQNVGLSGVDGSAGLMAERERGKQRCKQLHSDFRQSRNREERYLDVDAVVRLAASVGSIELRDDLSSVVSGILGKSTGHHLTREHTLKSQPWLEGGKNSYEEEIPRGSRRTS
jgi:hypothetical protein